MDCNCNCNCDKNTVRWVRGNSQPLIIPLEKEVMTEHGEIAAEPYYPAEGAVVTVYLVGRFMRKAFTPEVEGNNLIIHEDGTLGAGTYGVEVTVDNPDGSHNRSMWENQVVITDTNRSVLEEWDEFKDQEPEARSAIFFFAKGDKGDKGDAFTYDDFTPEQLEGLRGPAGQDGADGIDGVSGGMLFPVMRFDPETGVLTITGLEQEVDRIRYDEETAELIIRLQ